MLQEMVAWQPPKWREPASFDRLPLHRSESPTGYSSAGCSPAEPASASPVTNNNSPIPIQRANHIRRSTSLRGMQANSRSSGSRQRGVPSLLCKPGDISILRRHAFHEASQRLGVYRRGSMCTGPGGRSRAIVRAASSSVGNGNASFFNPHATVGNRRVSQAECPPGYATRITNMANSPCLGP